MHWRLITFRTLLHLGPNVITFRTLLHLGKLLHLGLQQHSLKFLDTKGGFYGTYFSSKRRNPFFLSV